MEMPCLKGDSNEKSSYKNLISEVQQLGCFGSVKFSSGIHSTIEYKNKVVRNADDVWKSVLNSERVQWIIANIVRNQNVSSDVLLRDASRILKEMAYKEHLNLVRGFGCLMFHTMNSLYKDGVYYNDDSIDEIRKAVQEHPVILMPSHRCYMDFLVLSVLCVHLRLPLPAIASGRDFMTMKGVSFLLRSSGAFFMRRSFGSDQLYWALFTEYVHSIIVNGDRTMEFFIEGTRSRSGKSLNPKLGLFSVVAEPYLKAQIYDIVIVPVSISYDRILEESLYAYELLGVPKPKESTTGLFKVSTIFQNNYGSLHVHFGQPLSLRQECSRMDRTVHSCYPRYMMRLTSQEQRCLTQLAYKVVRMQQKNMVIGLWPLIATVLLQNPAGMNLANMVKEVQWLSDIVRKCGMIVCVHTGDLTDIIKSTLFQYEHLIHMTIKNSYQFISIRNIGAYQQPTKLKSQYQCLPDILRSEAAIQLMLASYRNQVMHIFVRPALLAISIGNYPVNKKLCCSAMKTFHFLENIFIKEFIFVPGQKSSDFEEAVKFLVDASALQLDGKLMFVPSSGQKLIYFLKDLMRPFFDCYMLVCQYMAEHHHSCEMSQLCIQVQLWVAQQPQNNVMQWEVLSKDVILNAIHGLASIGALKLRKEPGRQMVHIKRAHIHYMAQQLELVFSGRSSEEAQSSNITQPANL